MNKAVTCILCVFLLCTTTGCGKQEANLVTRSGFFFDTMIAISVQHEEGEALLEKCFSLCEEYERIFSRTDSESELNQLNHRDSDTVTVSEELSTLIGLGLKYGALSDGLFDITIAPLSDLWDFKSENPQIPSQKEISQALEKVDYKKVHLKGNKVTFDSKDTMIDLGAIVKGWAADEIKAYLQQEGVTSAMINLGGNVLTVGSKPDKSPWKVGIQKPFASRNETITVVEAVGQSVVSSGTYERYFEKEGIRYHHILDPRTGYPVDTELSQVTIISEESVTGDLYSTLFLLEGYEKAKSLAEADGTVKVLFVSSRGELLE